MNGFTGQIDVQLLRENEDGSATYSFNLTPEMDRILLTYGIRCAIEAGLKAGKEWMDTLEESTNE